MDEYLHSLEFSLPTNAVYIFDSAHIQEEQACSPTQRRGRQLRRGRGNGEQGDSDEYYDGFRCLYNEETTPGAEGGGIEGLFDSQKNDVSPCPPLHPAVI